MTDRKDPTRNEPEFQRPDPADQTPAEGGSMDNATEQERGQGPHIDPALKDQPAEGGRRQGES